MNNNDNNDDLGQVYKTITGNAFYLHNFQLVLCVCLRMRIFHVILDHGKFFGVLGKNLKKDKKNPESVFFKLLLVNKMFQNRCENFIISTLFSLAFYT